MLPPLSNLFSHEFGGGENDLAIENGNAIMVTPHSAQWLSNNWT
jgi:hypothetical protein